MTIPIQPGPFSFLATLGQGVGNAFEQRDKARQQKFVNNVKQIENIQSLIKDGILESNVLAKPGFFNLLTSTLNGGDDAEQDSRVVQSGLRAQPGELKDRGQARFIEGLLTKAGAGDGSVSPELYGLTFGTPTPGAIGEEVLKTNVTNQKVLGASGEMGPAVQSAVTGVPTKQMAEATQNAAVGEALESDASRYVAGAIAKFGGGVPMNPAAVKTVLEESYAAYAADMKNQNQTAILPLDDYRKKYFDSALFKLQATESANQLRASAGLSRAAAAGDQMAQRALVAQLEVASQQLIKANDAVNKLETFELFLSSKYETMTPEQRLLPENRPSREAYIKVQNARLFQEAAQATFNAFNRQISGSVTAPVTGEKVPTRAGASTTTNKTPPTNVVQSMVKAMLGGTLDRAKLVEGVKRDASRLNDANEVIRQYNAQSGTKKPVPAISVNKGQVL